MRISRPSIALSLAGLSLTLAPAVQAEPTFNWSNSDNTVGNIVGKVGNSVSWLCELPLLNKACQRIDRVLTAISPSFADFINLDVVSLPIGKVQGIKVNVPSTGNQVMRYTIPYAKAPINDLRFKPTVSIPKWSNVLNATQLPQACPQSAILSTIKNWSEDCLFMNVYVPKSATPLSKLPVLVYIHGGSFVYASSTDAGLDGSTLADKGGIIVITIQYRLGVFGLLRSSALGIEGNMAVWDVIEALKFIQANIGALNGLPNSITLAGQSSGASMIKTLLTVPQASSLFQRAILHSAPLDYGDHPLATSEALGGLFMQILNSGCTDISCLQAKPAADLIAAQDTACGYGPSVIPGISASEPFRPLIDNKLLASSFFTSMNQGAAFPATNKDLIFTTVLNEAAPTIASLSRDAQIAIEDFEPYVRSVIDGRADQVLASGLYKTDATVDDTARLELERFATDWIWRCANQQAAVNITAHDNANRVFLAEFDIGIPYASNVGISFCKGKVCHQDDIEAVFSTGGSSLTSAQQALEQEVLLRWTAFAKNGSPNASGYTKWEPVSVTNPDTSSEVVKLNMLQLNGATSTVVQEQRQAECGRNGLWGRLAKFDAQIYQRRLRRK